MRSGRVYLKPGESCGKHSTKAHEEMLVFLAGKGTAYSEQNPDGLDVGLGKVIYIPPHTEHDIKNTSDSELIYIYCVAPIKEDK
jgi:quercetin dioxygenase-like cupin family protein